MFFHVTPVKKNLVIVYMCNIHFYGKSATVFVIKMISIVYSTKALFNSLSQKQRDQFKCRLRRCEEETEERKIQLVHCNFIIFPFRCEDKGKASVTTNDDRGRRVPREKTMRNTFSG